MKKVVLAGVILASMLSQGCSVMNQQVLELPRPPEVRERVLCPDAVVGDVNGWRCADSSE